MPKNVLIVATIMLRKICMPKAGIKRREQIKFIVSMRKKNVETDIAMFAGREHKCGAK